MRLYDLPPGTRAIVSGSTGSGKSTLVREYLQASRFHWIVFNPKLSRVFGTIRPGATTVLTLIDPQRIERAVRQSQFTVLNFDASWGWRDQDVLLSWLTQRYENIGFCIDELYTLHNNGKAGPGLTGLLTRGRELRQAFIGCTQRPVFVSRFVYSEADIIIEFHLALEDDRKIIFKNTGSPAALAPLRGHDFLYFDVAARAATIYRSKAA